MMYAHLLEPAAQADGESVPTSPPEVDEVIAKAVAKSKDDRYAAAIGVCARAEAGGRCGSGVGRVGRGGAARAGSRPCGASAASGRAAGRAAGRASRPAQPPPAQPPPAQPPPAGTATGAATVASSRRRRHPRGRVSPASSSRCWRSPAGSPRRPRRRRRPRPPPRVAGRPPARQRLRPALRAGAVTGREGVHAQSTPGKGRAGDQSLRVCSDGSNLSTRRSSSSRSIAALRLCSTPTGRVTQASAWHGNTRSWVRLSPSRRTSVDPPDREAGRSVLLPPGREGELRHRLDAREARQRRSRGHARHRDRAWPRPDDRRRLVELAQRLHRQMPPEGQRGALLSTPSPGSPAPRDRPRRRA